MFVSITYFSLWLFGLERLATHRRDLKKIINNQILSSEKVSYREPPAESAERVSVEVE